jgi:hypothetical protein
MIRSGIYCICLLLFVVSSCLPQPSIRKEALTEEGEAVIYLQPLPQEAEKLRFSIEAISAVRTDGSHVPLPLSLNEVKGSDRLGRQSILATGTLPPGSYTGLAVTLNKAFVQTAEGEMALLVPEKQLSAEKLFAIERQKALALFLTVNPSRIISSEISSLSLTRSQCRW